MDKIKNNKMGIGFDASKNVFVDMKKEGIIDPTKVSRSALENSASIASMVLTTESIVVNIEENIKEEM